MIGKKPKFYTSKYFDPETWQLSRDAPEDLKQEFKEYMEAGGSDGFAPDYEDIPLPTLEERKEAGK